MNFRATTAIIDSGTTAIVLSNSDASSIHNVRSLQPCHGRRLYGLPNFMSTMVVQRCAAWTAAMPPAHYVENQAAAVHCLDVGITAVSCSDWRVIMACKTFIAEFVDFAQQIPGARFWSAAQAYNVTCNVNTLPNVTFVFDGQSFSVPPRLYVQQVGSKRTLALVCRKSCAWLCRTGLRKRRCRG